MKESVSEEAKEKMRSKAEHKVKSKKQVRYLLSKGSPLSKKQKDKLKHELHEGDVKIKG
jgi:hypothetical protein